jgi:HSP90 family molecular chaperone
MLYGKKINSSLNNNEEKEITNCLVNVIYSQACLIEGDTIQKPSEFAEQLNTLLTKIK